MNCKNCYGKLSADGKFCDNCGAHFPSPESGESPSLSWEERRQKSISKNVFYFAIGSMVLIACVLLTKSSSLNDSSGISAPIDSPTTASSQIDPSDFLGRLNADGADEWTQDAFKPLNPIVGFEADYISGGSSSPEGCNVSIYDSQSHAENSMNDNSALNLGSIWAGADYLTSKGVILTSHGESDACVANVFQVFNWQSTVSPTSPAANSKSDSGSSQTATPTVDQLNADEGSSIKAKLIERCQKLPAGFSKYQIFFLKNISSADGVPGLLFSINHIINIQDFPSIMVGPSMATSDIDTWKAWGCGGYIYS